MADRVNISELSSALDSYLERIEKVKLSKSALMEQASAIADLVSVVNLLSTRINELSAAGSSRAGLVSDIRSGLLSGADVSTLLLREGRAAAMRPDGVPGLSLSEVQRIKSASGAVSLLQNGGASLGMLQALSTWGSAAGQSPSPGGMFSTMESRMLGLGVGLTRGGAASLVADIEGDSVREEMLSSAEDIHEGTEALLEALASRGKPSAPAAVQRSETKPVVPQSEKTSWWSTLKTVGLVLGSAAGIFGLLGNDSVQKFIQENLLSAEGRQALWGKLESLFGSLTAKVSDFVALGERINTGMQKVLQLLGATGENAVQQSIIAGTSTYNTLSEGDQAAIRDFQSGYERTLQSPAPLPAGISSADVSALRTGASVAALKGMGAFAGVNTAANAYKALRSIYQGVRGLSAAGKASGLLSGFRTMYSLSKFAAWGLVAGAAFDAAGRQAFNKASLLAAYEEGSPVALFYPEYGGGTEPGIVALGSLPVEQDDGSTTAFYNTLSAEDQLGYATSLQGALHSYRQEQNEISALQGILDMGDYVTLDSGDVVSTSSLKGLQGEELSKFLQQNRSLHLAGVRNTPMAFGDLASELLIQRNRPVYALGAGDSLLSSLDDSERSGFLSWLRSGRYKRAGVRDIASYNIIGNMFEQNTSGNLAGGFFTRGAAKLLAPFGSLSRFTVRADSGFSDSAYADVLRGMLDSPRLLPELSQSGPGGPTLGVGTVLAEPVPQAQGSRSQSVTVNSASTTAPTYIYQVGSNSQEGAER